MGDPAGRRDPGLDHRRGLPANPRRRGRQGHQGPGPLARRALELELPVVSVGGPAAGLYVELAGDAIDRGLLTPSVAEMNGCSSTLPSGRPVRCELPEAPIRAGVVLPNAKRAEERFAAAPEDVFFRLRVRGEARAKGRGLLTVRIGFLGEGTRGSLMREPGFCKRWLRAFRGRRPPRMATAQSALWPCRMLQQKFSRFRPGPASRASYRP